MKNITHLPEWNRKFCRVLAKKLCTVLDLADHFAEDNELERYRKHFHTRQHASLLLFHGLTQSPSLRQSYALIQGQQPILKACQLLTKQEEICVSYSQFAASNHSRDASFMQHLAHQLFAQVKKQGYQHKEIRRDIRLLDSTCIKISPLLSSWADGFSNLRLQVQHIPAQDMPERILLTNYRQNDCQGIDTLLLNDEENLHAQVGQTFVFDLGYYSHKRLQKMRKAGLHFVVRRHTQASIDVQEHLPVQASLPGFLNQPIQLLSDQRITLGSPNNRAGAVLPNLRLVSANVTRDKKVITYQVITDRWDLTAHEVILFYLWRWEIELLFRWLKSHLCLEQLLGYTPNAIKLSIWLVIVTHLFTLLLSIAMNSAHRSALFLRQLLWAWAQLTHDDFFFSSAHQLALPFFNST